MDPVEIYLYEEVTAKSAAAILSQIRAAGNNPIRLRINSIGGDVFQGYAIYNALLGHLGGVTTYIDGMAASIAAYIAMAGSEIRMAGNAMIMIHEPSQDGGGKASDHRRAAELLDKIGISITDAFARRTRLPREQVAAMIANETYLSAAEAKSFGFIDEITEPLAVAAKVDLSKFPNMPAKLRAYFDSRKSIMDNITSNAVKYLVPDGNHLPYTDETGKPDHHLMGAAWAALHGGYRGNKYDGPDKEKAIEKLKGVYKSEGMETPKDEAESDVKLTLGLEVVDVDKAVATATASLRSQIVEISDQLRIEAEAHGKVRDELKAAKHEVETVKGQLLALADQFSASKERVTLIEAFVKDKGHDLVGIEKFQALRALSPEDHTATPEAKWEKYQQLREDKQNPGAAFAYWKENKAELEKFAKSKRTPR